MRYSAAPLRKISLARRDFASHVGRRHRVQMVIEGGCHSTCITAYHVIESPLTSGRRRSCRDGGGGDIAPGFVMLNRANRASHIDPPASSDAIMRRARPYRGENPGPGKDHRTRA